MSELAQAVFYFIAVLLFVIAALLPARTTRVLLDVEFGWLGLAVVAFVWFWIANQAA